jgi:hypothetical protein
MNDTANTQATVPADGTGARIDRREAIRRVAVMLGGVAFVGGSRLVAAVENAVAPASGSIGEFTVADIAFLDEIAETILPETKTPGAKAAATGAFMARMVTDCYWPVEQKIFRQGMQRVDAATRKAHGVAFMQATAAQRLAVLKELDRESKRVMDAQDRKTRKDTVSPRPSDANSAAAGQEVSDVADELPIVGVHAEGEEPRRAAHYFRMMKELAMLGYFTSEIGCTVAQRYAETPGRYDPCIPYKAGDPAWASHA